MREPQGHVGWDSPLVRTFAEDLPVVAIPLAGSRHYIAPDSSG